MIHGHRATRNVREAVAVLHPRRRFGLDRGPLPIDRGPLRMTSRSSADDIAIVCFLLEVAEDHPSSYCRLS